MIAGLWALLTIATPQPHSSAVIVGVNEPFDQEQTVLKYADDDAARFYEILSHRVEHLELLTLLDAESQSLYPQAASLSRVPNLDQLKEAMARARAKAEAARAQGRRTELYFVYTGHGRVQGGEGQVKLLGGVLGRYELIRNVLSSQTFDRIHVIIDACNAYLLVNARGEDREAVTERFDDAFEQFLEGQTLNRFPHVGVVLSTNGAGATHEWSRYQGGVFSHEVRSALTGAADADENSRVDYAELEAFLAAANLNVPAVAGRPKIFVRPPVIERRAVLLSLPEAMPTLQLPAPLSGRYYLEDDRGVRYAELNKAKGYAVALRLVPRSSYQLVDASGGRVAQIAQPSGVISLSLPLQSSPRDDVPRGESQLPPIFRQPFGPRFMGGFRASLAARLRASSPRRSEARPLLWVGGFSAGFAAVASGLAIWQNVEARRAFSLFQTAFREDEVDRLRGEVKLHRNASWGVGITAGALAVNALVLFLWEHFR